MKPGIVVGKALRPREWQSVSQQAASVLHLTGDSSKVDGDAQLGASLAQALAAARAGDSGALAAFRDKALASKASGRAMVVAGEMIWQASASFPDRISQYPQSLAKPTCPFAIADALVRAGAQRLAASGAAEDLAGLAKRFEHPAGQWDDFLFRQAFATARSLSELDRLAARYGTGQGGNDAEYTKAFLKFNPNAAEIRKRLEAPERWHLDRDTLLDGFLARATMQELASYFQGRADRSGPEWQKCLEKLEKGAHTLKEEEQVLEISASSYENPVRVAALREARVLAHTPEEKRELKRLADQTRPPFHWLPFTQQGGRLGIFAVIGLPIGFALDALTLPIRYAAYKAELLPFSNLTVLNYDNYSPGGAQLP